MHSSPWVEAAVFMAFFVSPAWSPLVRGQYSGQTCLAEMELPRFAVISEQRSGGQVRALITLGPEGAVSELELKGSARSLEKEVESIYAVELSTGRGALVSDLSSPSSFALREKRPIHRSSERTSDHRMGS